MAAVRLSSPGLATPRERARGDPGSPIPREARKSPRRHPPLRFGPSGCGVDRLGFPIAIEAAVVAELENSKEK
jgi:hypothetical protein